MRCHYNEQLRLHICDLTYLNWLNGKIIRTWEDGEFLYENGVLTDKVDPEFKRKKISDVYGLWDCEVGWEVDVRDQGPTRFVVTNPRELDKIQEHLEGVYWGMVDSGFNSLKYYIEENIESPGLGLRINDELDKIQFGLNPSSFQEEPVLVKYMEPIERKIFDRLPRIYADLMNNGRQLHVPRHDMFHVYEHYRVDALLKYRDWLNQLKNIRSNKVENRAQNVQAISKEIPQLKLNYRAAALYLRYNGIYVVDPRGDRSKSADQYAQRLCNSDAPTAGQQLVLAYNHNMINEKHHKKLVDVKIDNPISKELITYIKSLRSIIEHLSGDVKSQALKDLEFLQNEYESLK